MRKIIFVLLLFSNYCLAQETLRSSVNTKYFAEYLSAHLSKAILYDSLKNNEECKYIHGDSLFSGFALKNYSPNSSTFYIINNGIREAYISFDSTNLISSCGFDSLNLFGIDIEFYKSGNIFFKTTTKLDEYDKNWCNILGIHDVFGPSIKNAEIIEYYKSGQIISQKSYNEIGPNGKWKFYHPNGKLYKYYLIENNKQIGIWKQYKENGKKIGFIKFKNDKVYKAKWYFYDEKLNCFVFTKLNRGNKHQSNKCSKYNFDEKLRYIY